MTEPAPPKSDLGVRVLSAVVMIAVAGTALWLGGAVWAAFVAAVAMGALWEWRGLVRRLTDSCAMARCEWCGIGGYPSRRSRMGAVDRRSWRGSEMCSITPCATGCEVPTQPSC